MAFSHWEGPIVATGAIGGTNGGNVTSNQDAGPNSVYQGQDVLDLRYGLNKDNILNGTIRGHYTSPEYIAVDAVPSQLKTNNIAVAAAVVSGTAMTLAVASTGIATAVTFQPFQNSTLVTAPIVLDFGFDTLNVTASSTTATVANSAIYWIGMPLVVANVGNAGGTTQLNCYVTAVPTATTITLSTAPSATNSSAPVGTGNTWGPTGLAGNTLTPTATQPYIAAGADLIWDPTQGISRGVRVVSAVTTAAGGTFTVNGYTEYGEPQTQLLTHAGGVSTIFSKKTFKYITSIVPNFTDTAVAYSIGTSDVFGVNLRNDKWEYTRFFWAGALLTASTGWTAADTTSPATNGSGDVRGTIQIGTNGPLTSGATGGATNGTLRLVLSLMMPLYNMTRATPASPTPMYGSTPV